jgi:hypothetical protein
MIHSTPTASPALPASTASEPLDFDVAAAIAPELTPLQLPPERGVSLQQVLMERVRASALAHRDFITVRREDGGWAAAGPGLQKRPLSSLGGVRVDLLRLAAHEPLPWAPEAEAQELLVLEGELAIAAAGAAVVLSPRQHIVLARDAATQTSAGSAGAALYVRSRIVALEHLPQAEALWWATAQAAPIAAAVAPCEWSAYVEGVEAAVLHAHDNAASMLVRMVAGANVPNHGHGLNEDCYMLEGDMFLGDILMRQGDYQLARSGAEHVGIGSDVGGLFYFHGAIPPAASEGG